MDQKVMLGAVWTLLSVLVGFIIGVAVTLAVGGLGEDGDDGGGYEEEDPEPPLDRWAAQLDIEVPPRG